MVALYYAQQDGSNFWVLKHMVTIQINTTKQHYQTVLFIPCILYKMVLACESVDEILKCIHSKY